MTAYVVVLREAPVHDQEAVAAYHAVLQENPVDPKLTMLALYGDIAALEGAPADGVVLLSFPTVADARAWYEGPYSRASEHRKRSAPYRLMIVEGV